MAERSGARRVVVTGMGVVSALGPDLPSFWDALSGGRHGFAPIRAVDCSTLRSRVCAEARGFEPAAHFEPRELDFLDRFAQFAVAAAREAVRDAGLHGAALAELAGRTAVVTGSCVGGLASQEQGYVRLFVEDRRPHPLTIPRTMANAGASHISMSMGLTGPAFTTSSACSSANHALGTALMMLRSGMADLAIAGGSEAPFTLGNLKAWDVMRVVATDACRPFSKNRRGMLLGEGGAMLVLEPLEAARARGARIYAELAGFGMSADAHHLTQPSGEGASRAMRLALQDSGLAAEQIGYVNAHGTGTPANDAVETASIRAALGAHAERVAVSSTKSMHGHGLGAAGAFEAVATVMALHTGTLPPTAGYQEPDPECDLDVIPNHARAARIEAALSNSFAFGGLNAVLAFRKDAG
jgi:nodulation protein E